MPIIDDDLKAAIDKLHGIIDDHYVAIAREAEALGLPKIRLEVSVEDYASGLKYLRMYTA